MRSFWFKGIHSCTAEMKGGDRRTKIPEVDLWEVVEQHVLSEGVDGGLSFGAYEHIARSHAAFVPGLVFNKIILKKALQGSPHGYVRRAHLENCIEKMANNLKGLNKTKLPNRLFAGAVPQSYRFYNYKFKVINMCFCVKTKCLH